MEETNGFSDAKLKLSFKVGSWIMRLPDWILNLAFNPLTKPFVWRFVTCENHS